MVLSGRHQIGGSMVVNPASFIRELGTSAMTYGKLERLKNYLAGRHGTECLQWPTWRDKLNPINAIVEGGDMVNLGSLTKSRHVERIGELIWRAGLSPNGSCNLVVSLRICEYCGSKTTDGERIQCRQCAGALID